MSAAVFVLLFLFLRQTDSILPGDPHTLRNCTEKEFRCDNGRCIPLNWKCDNENDCLDRSDENPLHCTKTCGADQFTCKSGECLAQFMICDNDNDCEDGSDEVNCTSKCKNSKDFQCPDKTCIPETWRCDGENDCFDHSDEMGCSHSTRHHLTFSLCLENEFQCKDRITCINPSWVCDGYDDCLDGDDESSDMCSVVSCRSDQFKCKNQTCIPGFLFCNGHPDCFDGSDEENCVTTGITSSCKESEFDCGHNICIPSSKVCDRKSDCPNSEDEPFSKCNLNECIVNNGGCSHYCVDTATSYYCSCKPGFKLTGNYSCEDINECDNPGACSHMCINEEGTYKCECQAGYLKDPYDRTRCKPTEGHTQLLFTRLFDIRIMSVDHRDITVVVNDTRSATALDFVYKTGFIFWSDRSDSNEQSIYKAPIDQGNARTVVINNDVIVCDGLAVDWIYDHVYWTDTGKNTIEVATFDGIIRKTLISHELDEPRALALDPFEGWMYWSDWGEEGRIERAGLDGTHREIIVSFDIKWPNGLTLDLVRRRLYWADAKLNLISSVNYDGSGRTVILKSSETLHHPFSISVFEDVVYWTDWEKKTIFKANKFNGSNVTPLTPIHKLQSPMVVHVYHQYRQPSGTNYCQETKANCSHLCLPAPFINLNSPKITCACPDDLELMQDGLNCIHKENSTDAVKLPPTVVSSPKISRPFSAEYSNVPVLAIVVLSIAFFVVFSSLITLYVYRNFLNKNTSVNFDNPVYRKTTEDNFFLAKSHSQPGCTTLTDAVQRPLTSDAETESV
ncbi:very low-density lipoprotein receptor isoform X2 [Halyomorpha halys]|uniref:very low-density lipoprotein receptor isoform X2 n=1 Tax=Halyomorpha halys TaxID=286706 RepID=UPI0006D50F54